MLLVATFTSPAVTWFVLRLMLRSGWTMHALDRPNARSLHNTPVPRVGGLALAVGVSIACTLCWSTLPDSLHTLAWAALALVAISWVDDVRGLPAAPRLIAHLTAATLWAWTADIPAAWLPFTVLCIGWATNLYNFMDGADGVAGGMTMTGFGAYAIGFALTGRWGPAAFAAGVAGAAAGFLRFNVPPARVFLGDSGAIPLGFLAAALGVHGWLTDAWSPVFPLLAFLPFWFDASVTLARRTFRGELPWRAHNEHFYQRAVLSGLGHKGMVHRAWLLMAACAIVAIVSNYLAFSLQALILAGSIILTTAIAIAIERLPREPSTDATRSEKP